MFPIHEKSLLQKLQKTWVQKFLERQPIGKKFSLVRWEEKKSIFVTDKICDYFGVQIALYFAWLGHYTTALFIPAIVGLLFWVSKKCLLKDTLFSIFYLSSFSFMDVRNCLKT